MSRLRLALPALLVTVLIFPLHLAFSDDAGAACSTRVSRIVLKPATVIGGRSTTATVTLACAPRSRARVNITATSGIVVPRYVYVSARKRTKVFTVRTKLTAVTTKGKVRATRLSRTVGATLTRRPAACYPKSVSVTPNPLTGGVSATGKVILTCLSTSAKAVKIAGTNKVKTPTTVVVPARRQSATFPVRTGVRYGPTSGATSTATGTVRAGLSGRTKSTAVTMRNVPTSCAVRGLTLPSLYYRGETRTGTVTLGCTAPVPIPVAVSTDDSRVTVPGTVTVPRGRTSVTFSISTKIQVPLKLSSELYGAYYANVFARDPIETVEKRFTVLPGIYPLTYSSIAEGLNDFSLHLSLSGEAATGTVVQLASSHPGVVYPKQVTFPEGQRSMRVNPTSVTPGATDQAVTVTATLGNRQFSTSKTLMRTYVDGDPFKLWTGAETPWTFYGPGGSGVEIDLGRPAGPSGVTVAVSVTPQAATITIRAETYPIPPGAQRIWVPVDFTAVTEGTERASISFAIGSVSKSIDVVHEPSIQLIVPSTPATIGEPIAGEIRLSGPSDHDFDIQGIACLADTEGATGCESKLVTIPRGQTSAPLTATPTSSTSTVQFITLVPGADYRRESELIWVDRR